MAPATRRPAPREPDTLTAIVWRTLLAIGVCTAIGMVGGLVYGLATDDVGEGFGLGVAVGATAGAVAGILAAALGRDWRRAVR
jgi:hypothetical protein